MVAATGTGKTVVAALDYRQLVDRHGRDLSLLFVAHREEILGKSLATYRAVLRDGVVRRDPRRRPRRRRTARLRDDPVAARATRLAQIAAGTFDVVVVDEFHHAAAPTYDRLLNHLEPRELLGLTATPERMDGQDVTEWFGGRIAVELRLWEAIDQGFLVPFQYFGVADGTDSQPLRGGAAATPSRSSSDLITDDDAARRKAARGDSSAIVLDPSTMRALGFCVSVEHAEYMARKFTEAGLESVALTGDDAPSTSARAALGALAGR